jgi:hypothetical protein
MIEPPSGFPLDGFSTVSVLSQLRGSTSGRDLWCWVHVGAGWHPTSVVTTHQFRQPREIVTKHWRAYSDDLDLIPIKGLDQRIVRVSDVATCSC